MFLVGDGIRIKFWEDAWCGEDPLCEKFPGLHTLANSNGARVQEVLERSGEAGSWNPHFVRPFNDWEMEMVEEFIATVRHRKISPLEKD